MGRDTAHWKGFGRIPLQVGLQADIYATLERTRKRLSLPPLEDVMAEAGFKQLETYVSLCQKQVAKFIDTRPIMDLCLAAERRPG